MPRPHSRNGGLENAPPDIFSRSRRSAEVPNVACTNVAHESCVQWHRPCLAAFLVVALPVLRMSQSHGKRTARALERMEGALLFYDQLSPTLNCRLPLFRSSTLVPIIQKVRHRYFLSPKFVYKFPSFLPILEFLEFGGKSTVVHLGDHPLRYSTF